MPMNTGFFVPACLGPFPHVYWGDIGTFPQRLQYRGAATMARTVKDANLQTRAAREKLPARKKPHWRTIDPERHIGYYKGARGGTWIARRYAGGGEYKEQRLGYADDRSDANGLDILS